MPNLNSARQRGFTLLELVVVLVIIAIIVTIAIPVFNNVVESSRRRVTQHNMVEIERAILGDPSANFVGFRQLMRRNPDPLSELWDLVGSAYNPFLELGDTGRAFVAPEAGIDGWQTPFSWNSTLPGTLTSLGPNRANNGGGGDDIVRVIGTE